MRVYDLYPGLVAHWQVPFVAMVQGQLQELFLDLMSLFLAAGQLRAEHQQAPAPAAGAEAAAGAGGAAAVGFAAGTPEVKPGGLGGLRPICLVICV